MGVLVDVLTVGRKIFKDNDVFLQWLHSPCKALDEEAPLDLLRAGRAELVLDELMRIEQRPFRDRRPQASLS